MTKKRVLHDHLQRRKKLVPPLLQALGDKHAPYSWTRQLVPEALWIWLLIEAYGFERGARIAALIGRCAAVASNASPTPLFAKLTSFAALDTSEQQRFLTIAPVQLLLEINTALAAFFEVFPDNPLSFIWDERPVSVEIRDKFSEELKKLYDRYGRPTALTLAATQYMAMEQGKLHLGPFTEKFAEDLRHIVDYPETERSKFAASGFRAGAPIMLMMSDSGLEHNEPWLKEFWERVGTLGQCSSSYANADDEEVPADDPVGKFIFSYRNAARKDLYERLDNWKADLNDTELYEVISALLSRQTTLTLDLAISPPCWNPNVAPLLLRAMADVYITIAWILASDSNQRAARFIEDGIGAVKLEIAHRKNANASGEENEDAASDEYIQMLQSWLDAQRIDALIEVNLGSWSGINTRQMAQEAGCIDFYNYVYQPFSAVVHSNWFHVHVFNTVACENPAHRNHRIGKILAPQIDPHWLYLAAKYLQKSFSIFDEKMNVETPKPTAFDLLVEMYDEIWLDEETSSQDG